MLNVRLRDNNKNHTNVDISLFFQDPEEKNFYRVKVFKNDTINNDNYRLYDDQYTNGQETELRVANATAGDTFRIELLSLDQATYEYYVLWKTCFILILYSDQHLLIQ